MRSRSNNDQPPAGHQQRHYAVGKNEMAEMIGAELGLKTIYGTTERRMGDTSIVDDDIERTTVGDENVCAFTNARQRSKIEFDEFNASAVARTENGRLDRFLSFNKVPRRTNNFGPMRCKDARRLSRPRPAETPVTRTRLPLRSAPSSTSSVVEVSSNRAPS